VSGGGPHALACGYYLPNRITAVGVASGIAPPDLPGANVGTPRSQRITVSLFLRAPVLFTAYFALMARLVGTSPQRILASFETGIPPSDRSVIQSSEVLRRAMVDDYIETARQRGRGQVSDWSVLFHPWGFNLAHIRVPVHFWQGEEDSSVPVAAARAQAATIPDSRLTIYPREAHLAFFTHRAEILSELRE
jgi:pimeloyl-ACP methyl ester carboxylesterase